MAVPTVVDSNFAEGNTPRAPAYSGITGLATGDIIYAFVFVRGASSIITPPAGFTSEGNTDNGTTISGKVYSHSYTSGDADPSFSWTGGLRGVVVIVAVRGGIQTAHKYGGGTGTATRGSAQVTAPSVTPTVADTLLIHGHAIDASPTSWTDPGGVTREEASLGGRPAGTTNHENGPAANVASTARSADWGGGTSSAAYVGITIAIKPPIPQALSGSLSPTGGLVAAKNRVRHTFESGTNGVLPSPANSNTAPDNGFDSVIGTALTYDNTHVLRGSLALKCVPSTAGGDFCRWGASMKPLSTPTFRFYIYITALPSALATNIVRVYAADGTTLIYAIQLWNGSDASHGNIITITATSAFASSTGDIPMNQWIRIEARVVQTGGATGSDELRAYWTDPDGLVPDVLDTSSSKDFGAQSFFYDFGAGGNGVSRWWLDDIMVTEVGFPGPSANGNLSGALTPSGVAAKAKVITLLGSTSPSGAMVRKPVKIVAGAIAAGNLAAALLKQERRTLTGALSPAAALGTLKHLGGMFLDGSLSPTATLLKRPAKSFTGSGSPTGALVKTPGKVPVGTMTSSGALVKRPGKVPSGALASAGALIRSAQKQAAGALSPSGVLNRSLSRALAGAISPTGALTRASSFVRSVAASLGFSAVRGAIANVNAQAHWRLNESSGTSALSLLGGFTGTYTGGVSLGAASLLGDDPDAAASFDGVDDYVALPAGLLGNQKVTGMSFIAWIKPNSLAGNQGVVGGSPSTGYVYYASGGILLKAGRVTMSVYDGAAYQHATDPAVLTTGQIYCVIGTYDPTDSKLRAYVNGVEVANLAVTDMQLAMSWAGIGRLRGDATGPGFFNGVIDEVAIVAAALTPTQVQQVYSAGTFQRLLKQAQKPPAGAISPAASLGRFVFRALTGALTSSGALIKKSTRSFVGSMSSSATMRPQANKVMVGAVSPTGLLNRFLNKVLSGDVSPSASVTAIKVAVKGVVGVLSFAGDVLRGVAKLVDGAITPDGAVNAKLAKFFGGSVSPTGVATKLPSKSVSGNIVPTGAFTAVRSKVVSGVINPTATLVRKINRALSGVISPTGAQNRFTTRVVDGAISFVGALARAFVRGTSGSLSSSGTLVRRTGKALQGPLNMFGLLRRFGTRTVEGVLSFTGALVRKNQKQLQGSITPSAAVQRIYARLLSGALSFAGFLDRITFQSLSGALDFSSKVRKKTARQIASALSFAGAGVGMARRFFSGAISPTGQEQGQMNKALDGSLTPQNLMQIEIRRALTGVFDFAGALVRGVLKPLDGTLPLSGTVGRVIARWLDGFMTPNGDVTNTTQRAVGGAISFVGDFARAIFKFFGGTLAPTGAAGIVRGRGVAGVISPSGSTKTFMQKALAGVIAPIGIIWRLMPKRLTRTISFAGQVVHRILTSFARDREPDRTAPFSGTISRDMRGKGPGTRPRRL